MAILGLLGNSRFFDLKMLKTLDYSRVFDFGSLLGEHHGGTSHFRTIVQQMRI